ncbi:50S ribosomal protein L9 [Desulfonatronum sp. SC1]|uniref:50S ribosomal protein L9 n=1 Tax=Desulfonatronum sp. SC1 TaxID=2109626 RepID=UPI000D303487|nr:50S ribosomal protein L9 [Desulfonatronum sp. SC1]PTN36851.1 50S ribosomal protein L9 [Desulfonatronum sp. SC1]
MEIILRTNMDNLGALGQVVNVKPGYGRNYLIPQGLAMLATPANKKRFELERKKLQEKLDAVRFAAQELADKISAVALRIPVRVGEGERLYGSVTSGNIADLLNTDHGLDVDKKTILLNDPLRALGDYTVEVRVFQDIRALLQVAVVRHDADQAGQAEVPKTDAVETTELAVEATQAEE